MTKVGKLMTDKPCTIKDIDFSVYGYWECVIDKKAADTLLAKNMKNNRSVKRKKETFARDMRRGRYIARTGETIKFDRNGTLVDGQNRLHAVRLADVSVVMTICTCVDDRAMLVVDSGTSRTDADAARIIGIKNEVSASTISRVAQLLHNGCYNTGTHIGMNLVPTRQEVTDFLEKNNDVIQGYVRQCGRIIDKTKDVRGMGIKGWFTCLWLTECMDREMSEQFLGMCLNNEGAAGQLMATISEPNPDGKAKDQEWMVHKYIECFNVVMFDGEYLRGKNMTERTNLYRKLFREYVDHAREADTTFKWNDEKK
jgi:hypothetical protein